MKKTISIIAAIMLIATALTGCGVDTPANDVFKKHDVVGTETKDDIKDTVANSKDKVENTDKSDKTDEVKKDESDKSDKSDKTDDKSNDKTTSTDNSASKTESKPNNNAQTTKPSGNKPVQETKPVEQPKHEHSYQVSSQTSATCGSEGKTVYTCNCGASYSDTNPATGHNWQTKTNSWTEQVWHEGTAGTYGCQCACGQTFTCYNEWHNHRIIAAQNREYGHGGYSDIEIGGTEGYYENVQHNDQYQQCANCGATQ